MFQYKIYLTSQWNSWLISQTFIGQSDVKLGGGEEVKTSSKQEYTVSNTYAVIDENPTIFFLINNSF